MGTCKTVSIRYYFVYNEEEGVLFVPESVRSTEVENSPSLDAEEVEYEDDVNYLRSLDPKDWKKQDHYRVLGIKNLRYYATDEIIKTAYRKKVLKHHPDKRKALGEEIRPDDDYYTCITMAYETLGTPGRRRAYDSVDPEFDDSLPEGPDLKKDFFNVFPKYFTINSRWSEKSKVLKLGNANTPREEVERFYNFWYDFKSWREFSYEDEEDKDKCADREERRMCEKINKAERQRKKKEEMTRIRTLVDLAYGADPRIAQFKLEDKERKLAAKRAKQTAAQAKKDEEERVLKEVALAKELAEQAERAKIETKRLEREAAKRALKREKKLFREVCKANNYFGVDAEILTHLQAADKICGSLNLLELEELNGHLTRDGRTAFLKAMHETEARIEAERLETTQKTKNAKNGLTIVKPTWSTENVQLLIKAVNLFPAGTAQRWDIVANFCNQHQASCIFNAKDVLAKAKDLQNADFSKSDLKEAANKEAFNTFEKERRNKPAPVVEMNGETSSPWTSNEQQLLEQALKTYPASTGDRWDRIAECLPNRSKKECMKRYKELVEIIKAKKAAHSVVKLK